MTQCKSVPASAFLMAANQRLLRSEEGRVANGERPGALSQGHGRYRQGDQRWVSGVE